MKIGFLGAGVWGICLARILALNGHEVIGWTRTEAHAQEVNQTRRTPHLPDCILPDNVIYTHDMNKVLQGAEVIVEAVTSAGIRPVFELVKKMSIKKDIPIVITSKGIEQNTCMTLPDVVLSVLEGVDPHFVLCLSGPGFAAEICKSLPTSVVVGGTSIDIATDIAKLFTTKFFRVYSNADLKGICLGGALKNIIAIACGVSDGLQLGTGARASLMTRGLHEIVRLACHYGAKKETLYGLSGMGDMFLTCSSEKSRNFRFGYLLSKGYSTEKAKAEIDMVVEGAYTAVSCMQMSKKFDLQMPITETVLQVIDNVITPQNAVSLLMQRSIKEEIL